MKVKITKLNGKPDSSHHVGFWLEGPECGPPEVGKPYLMDAMDGDYGTLKCSSFVTHYQWFRTTPLVEIDGDILITQHSTWKREVIT